MGLPSVSNLAVVPSELNKALCRVHHGQVASLGTLNIELNKTNSHKRGAKTSYMTGRDTFKDEQQANGHF